MNINLEKFSPQVAVIALLLCLIIGIFKKAVPNKFKKYLTFAPFVGGCLMYALYALLFGGEPFGIDIVQKGLECGAASTVFYMLYEQFLKNKSISFDMSNVKSLTVKNILQPLVLGEHLEEAANGVIACVNDCSEDLSRCARICGEKLKGKTNPDVSAIEIQAAVMLIINVLNTIS